MIMTKYFIVSTRVVVDASFPIFKENVEVLDKEVVYLSQVDQMVFLGRTQQSR